MALKITAQADLFKTPEETATGLDDTLNPGELAFPAADRTNDGWIKVHPRDPDADPLWMKLADNTQEVPDPAPRPVRVDGFVRQCLIAERTVNVLPSTAPWYIAADFLIARAHFETKIENRGSVVSGSDGVGPLQVTTAEWNRFKQEGGTLAADYSAEDRKHPTAQIIGAAFRMFTDAKSFSAVKNSPPNAAGETAPLIPSYLDVFHTYLSSPKASVAIREAELDPAKRDKAIGDLLDANIDQDFTAAKVAAIFARECFNGQRDATRKCVRTDSVAKFVAFTEAWLKDCLLKAFELIKQHVPSELPVVPAGAKPGWFSFAEADIGTKEGPDDAKIISYFDFTDIAPKPTSSKTAWCGAFAAACMGKSGNQDTIPKGSAAAVSWKTWGTGIPVQALDIPADQPGHPRGAVVVLSPAPGTDTTGHVGFFDKRLDGGRIQLLGGNQGDAVAQTPFSVLRVVAVRWTNAITSSANTKFKMSATGVPETLWKYADLIVERFSQAGFSKDVQLAAILANAILESGLKPDAKAGGSEESYGLFQCNRTKGLGKGYSIDQLKDPEINIRIIIEECKKLPAFAGVTTVERAVEIFVLDIERPLDKPTAINKRTTLAKALMA